MQQERFQLQVTEADIVELLRVNPLAAEQLKTIALQRRVADLERRLASDPRGRAQEEEGAYGVSLDGEKLGTQP